MCWTQEMTYFASNKRQLVTLWPIVINELIERDVLLVLTICQVSIKEFGCTIASGFWVWYQSNLKKLILLMTERPFIQNLSFTGYQLSGKKYRFQAYKFLLRSSISGTRLSMYQLLFLKTFCSVSMSSKDYSFGKIKISS